MTRKVIIFTALAACLVGVARADWVCSDTCVDAGMGFTKIVSFFLLSFWRFNTFCFPSPPDTLCPPTIVSYSCLYFYPTLFVFYEKRGFHNILDFRQPWHPAPK